VTLKGAQARVTRVDHGPAKVAMPKETHSIAGAFLFQLTRNQIVFAAKHPREERAGRWRAMRLFHADSRYQKGCQPQPEKAGQKSKVICEVISWADFAC
jgi:hypothetical protein